MFQPAMQSWFGYDMPIEQRLAMIRAAGFRRVALFWGPALLKEAPLYAQPDMAAQQGLALDSFHYPFLESNSIWQPGEQGDFLVQTYLQCIRDTAQFGVPSGVMHLTRTFSPPPLHEVGFARIARLVEEAERVGVNLALENLARNDYIDAVLARLASNRLRICYDAGHEFSYCTDYTVVECYAALICVVHLSDNDGTADQHLLPFLGRVNWRETIARLKRAKYSGGFVLEANESDPQQKPPENFLQEAYLAAEKLLVYWNEEE